MRLKRGPPDDGVFVGELHVKQEGCCNWWITWLEKIWNLGIHSMWHLDFSIFGILLLKYLTYTKSNSLWQRQRKLTLWGLPVREHGQDCGSSRWVTLSHSTSKRFHLRKQYRDEKIHLQAHRICIHRWWVWVIAFGLKSKCLSLHERSLAGVRQNLFAVQHN